MHQPIDHLYREGQIVLLNNMVIGQIVALFAPGHYFVRDIYGRGCLGTEWWWDAAGVTVRDQCDSDVA